MTWPAHAYRNPMRWLCRVMLCRTHYTWGSGKRERATACSPQRSHTAVPAQQAHMCDVYIDPECLRHTPRNSSGSGAEGRRQYAAAKSCSAFLAFGPHAHLTAPDLGHNMSDLLTDIPAAITPLCKVYLRCHLPTPHHPWASATFLWSLI